MHCKDIIRNGQRINQTNPLFEERVMWTSTKSCHTDLYEKSNLDFVGESCEVSSKPIFKLLRLTNKIIPQMLINSSRYDDVTLL